MDTLPLATVKAQLSALIDQVQDSQERILITRNGRAAAVLISVDELEGLEETLDIMSDPALMRALRESQRDIERGDVLDEAQLRASMAQHGRGIAEQ